MNKATLLSSIDEMIQNNGTIFYKSDNPAFQDAIVVKTKVDQILNTQENYKVFDEVAALNNSVRAAATLDEMIDYAANSYNQHFENELLKQQTMEKLNSATVQKMRDRRAKLKRLYTTYKKPLLQKNIQNSVANLSEAPPVMAAAAAAARKRRSTRKQRR